MREITLKKNEICFLKSVCDLIENNINSENKISINAFQISKDLGITYNGVRKIIKRLKEI